MPLELFRNLGLALAIGLLIGIERGWSEREAAEGGRTAGIRTYALSGLLGGIAAVLSQHLGGWAFAVLGLPFAAAFIVFKMREQADQDYSVTDVVAGLLVFGLGAYAALGGGRVAAAAGVVAAGLLAFKTALHSWLKALTWQELRGALVLLAMTLIVLPLIPDRAYGPFSCVNPHELWLLTIALAAASFAGYAANKIFGSQLGPLLGSAAGALVSSTAVTLHLAHEERRAPDPVAHAGAALLASAVMAARVCLVALALSPPLLARLALPLGAFAAACAAMAWLSTVRRKGESEAHAPLLKSPFELGSVLKFAALLGVVLAAARILSGLYGGGALVTVSALAGLADVDAATLTVSRLMAGGGVDLWLATEAVLLAAAATSLTKTVLALTVGNWRFGLLFAAGHLIAGTLAAAAFVWGPT